MKWLLRECGGQERLTAFLDGVIQAKKSVDGIDLSGAKLGEKWEFYGAHGQNLCFNGDWVLKHYEREKEFEVWWLYEESKAVIITVRIGENRRLHLESIMNQPDLVILSWFDLGVDWRFTTFPPSG